MLHNAYRRGSNAIALVCAAQPNFAKIRSGRTAARPCPCTIWEKDLHELAERSDVSEELSVGRIRCA